MQCHAIALGTTGTAYVRQQPRHIERKKNERKKIKKNDKKTTHFRQRKLSERHRAKQRNAYLENNTTIL